MKNCWVKSEQWKESLNQWLGLNDFRLSRKAKKGCWPLKSVDGPLRLLSFASPFKSSAFKVKLSLGYLVTPEICVSKLSSGYPLFFKHNLKFYTFSLNKSVKHLSLAGVSLLPFTNPVWMPCRWSLCIRRSLSLCSAFMCQESIPC